MSRLLLLLLTSTLIPVLRATSPGVQILRSPDSIVAPTGDEVLLECETSLVPDRFEWSYKRASASSNASSSNLRFKYLKASTLLHNITTDNAISKLRVYVRPETLGEYRCVGWFGPLAVSSTTARLQLASIKLLESQSSTAHWHWRVAPGNAVLLQCDQLDSKPAPTWSYYRNGIEIQPRAPASNGSLVLPSVTAEDSGNYSCAATNTVSGARLLLPRHMELQVLPMASRAPHFLSGQQQVAKQVTARSGDHVLLLCPGVGSPAPTAVWSSPNALSALQSNRTRVLPYGLRIESVMAQDAGSYSCYLDNGIRPPLEHFVELIVQQAPRILRSPTANLTNEGDALQLECLAQGVPPPRIYWLLNGESSLQDSEARVQANGYLLLRSVQKRHAGYVQCFASNGLGERSAGTLLQVDPKQIQASESEGSKQRPPSQGRKQTQMVPPTAPNVTRLSDESVMLRWSVPRNEGLHIQFFKVQYRLLVDGGGRRKNWQTTSENIPYGRSRGNAAGSAQGRSFTASVSNLRPQRYYRFRIMAVYSNNDNKESNTSAKFFLQRGATLEPLPVPELVQIEAQSESAVELHWRLASDAQEQLITGYYAYYRPSSSAGEFYKQSIEGAQARSFQITALEPSTIYEFKLQSFSAVSASEFSALRQGRTQHSISSSVAPPSTKQSDVVQSTPNYNETFGLSPLLTASSIGAGALILLLLLATCFCLCRRRSARGRPGNGQKPRPVELREDFVPLSKSRPRHIHITLNPLAQHEEKGSPSAAVALDQNELAYFQRHNAEQPSHGHAFNGHARVSSSLRRSQRNLERSNSVVGSGGNNNNLQQSVEATLAPPADSPRLPSSAKPQARVLLKRPRLSSRSDNLSSGSLSSVGV